MEKYSFSGKHVLVTGASGGLGSALVSGLAEMRAQLIVSSRSIKALNELIANLPENAHAIAIEADLSIPGQVETLAQKAVDAAGHIDVLFNNAGIGYFALMEETTEENIRYLFQVNTFSPMALIKSLLPQMKARGNGRVINIASCTGRVPVPMVGVYGGSKTALAVMANTMRLELAPAGIDIINIYPGTVGTSFEENALREKERPGLHPEDFYGAPTAGVSEKILTAAAGPPGEIWLDRGAEWMAATALKSPKVVDHRLAVLRDKVLAWSVETRSVEERRWRLWQLECSIACNLNCVMCPWTKIHKEKQEHGDMPQEVWQALGPHLDEVQSIDFSGGGEPLLQPRLVEWITEANAAGCETGFLTNGLLLKRETAEKMISAGVDWIAFSMDGATADIYEKIRQGSNFERVCENLENIAALRVGKIPKTMINFLLMQMNFHQVEEMVRLAAQLGVDQVNFKQCDVIRDEHGKGYGLFASKETRQVRRLEKSLSKVRRIAKKYELHTTIPSFTPDEQPVCDQDPRDSLFIRHDGFVAPCINLAMGGPTNFLGKQVTMPTVHYGRLPEHSLLDLWKTERCKFFRERFQHRVHAHETEIAGSSFEASWSQYQKALQAAKEAMPEAPEGCNVCHYLFDI
ncbi:MAG: SDR family NAD(P)-dependent oxidoreductase [Deltaproteobacteria bacterium]|nr:SDR family NAD(P)-dependent oxidoreductase [Deltaproteobacteria bacterium]